MFSKNDQQSIATKEGKRDGLTTCPGNPFSPYWTIRIVCSVSAMLLQIMENELPQPALLDLGFSVVVRERT
jgi:hypothetical protein